METQRATTETVLLLPTMIGVGGKIAIPEVRGPITIIIPLVVVPTEVGTVEARAADKADGTRETQIARHGMEIAEALGNLLMEMAAAIFLAAAVMVASREEAVQVEEVVVVAEEAATDSLY